MKFLLIIQVCSFLTGECKPPVQSTQLYNSWYECATAAHVNGLSILSAEGVHNINQYKLAIKYGCEAINEL